MKQGFNDKKNSVTGEVSLLIDAQFLEVLRLQMHKFATQQLSDSDLAEDAVQEALVGALKNVNSFTGRASLKTWVFAILKNKITLFRIAPSLYRKKNLLVLLNLPFQHLVQTHQDPLLLQ